MIDKIRCQSCGMPLGQGFFGTKEDGSTAEEYCTFCYRQGTFTNPLLTLQEMVQISINHMKRELGYPEEKARGLAVAIIPQLKRWKKD